jgi:hypothetical protein
MEPCQITRAQSAAKTADPSTTRGATAPRTSGRSRGGDRAVRPDDEQVEEPAIPPVSGRSGEGVASILPHLMQQQQAQVKDPNLLRSTNAPDRDEGDMGDR